MTDLENVRESESYHAEVINLSLKNKRIIKNYPILNVKSRFLGFVKIYTISVSENDIEKAVKIFQENMSTARLTPVCRAARKIDCNRTYKKQAY